MNVTFPDPADLDALGPAFLGLGLAQLLGAKRALTRMPICERAAARARS